MVITHERWALSSFLSRLDCRSSTTESAQSADPTALYCTQPLLLTAHRAPASTPAPLLVPLLCMEPTLPLTTLVAPALMLAAVIVPAPECRIVLLTRAEAAAPTVALSCLDVGKEAAAPTAPTLPMSLEG
jgi:hypothetical protein